LVQKRVQRRLSETPKREDKPVVFGAFDGVPKQKRARKARICWLSGGAEAIV
jgi:hypothetical protein